MHTIALLQDCCLDLTFVCKYMHDTLTTNSQDNAKNEMDSIFLSLRQLVSCVVNLERIAKIEQNEMIILKVKLRRKDNYVSCFTLIMTSNISSRYVVAIFKNG